MKEFVIGRDVLNNSRYSDDTVLMVETERRLHELKDKQSGKKELIISSKIMSMVVNKREN